MGQCAGYKQDGSDRCRQKAKHGSNFCAWHQAQAYNALYGTFGSSVGSGSGSTRSAPSRAKKTQGTGSGSGSTRSAPSRAKKTQGTGSGSGSTRSAPSRAKKTQGTGSGSGSTRTAPRPPKKTPAAGVNVSGWDLGVPEEYGASGDGRSGFAPDYFIVRGTDQKFGSVHVPARLVQQRPWPTIQGILPSLEEAIAWFEYIAEISGITLLRMSPGTGQAGLYSLQERAIYLADELFELPPLYGWVLAHELAHAVDPRFEAFGAIEYGHPRYKHRTRDYELIAESAAIEAFRSFGLFLYDDSEYLLSIAGKRWRKKLTGPDRGARLVVASGILRKPLPQDTREQQREYRRAQLRLQVTLHRLDKRIQQDVAVHNFTQDPFSRKAVLDLWR